MINKLRPVILFVTIILTCVAYGLWTLPRPKPADYDGFSSARVVEDIKVISQKPHSAAHPQERAQVREYLVDRLKELGADTIMQFKYDSLVGPKNKHVEYTFDAVNVVAEFAPTSESTSKTWLMLVAHYDSRFSQPMPKDTVWSYGAADDGYGLGVILETVSQAVKHRQEWYQGIKVLFTDAEEVGMMGMKAIWENNREVFDNVGLMINVEARGTWGPALLFETSAGNKKVMDLYASAAQYPYTYSLTTVVYKFMPNFTDFTIVKESIPGLNFSTVADINHYHTDLDSFDNISERSIQHYGTQILPVVMEYLTGHKYADKDFLRAEEDRTNFTIPLLGILSFTKSGYLAINVVLFIIFLLVFALEGVRGRIKSMRVFTISLKVLAASLLALVVAEGFAYLCALSAGAEFNMFGTVQGIPFDNTAMVLFMVLLFSACMLVYITYRAKAARTVTSSMRTSAVANAVSSYSLSVLYGTLALQFFLSAVLLGTIGENMMFMIPLFFATAALVLWRLTSLRIWLLVAIVLTLLHALSFLFALAMALTIGALGAVAMIGLIDIMVLIPLADLYLMPSRSKK